MRPEDLADRQQAADDTGPVDDPSSLLLSRRAFLALGVVAAAASVGSARGAARKPRRRAPRRRRRIRASLTEAELGSIVRLRIHPGVGIARVGNSADAFFIGPEVVGATPPPVGVLRDRRGAVARQAARFRVYGYDVDDDVVGEVTADDAVIDWGVHLANRKAQWFEFARAMDIPEATTVSRRNVGVAARRRLALDAGLRRSSGPGAVRLRASAMGVDMLLGEMLVDADGRLLVLAGRGRSASWNGRGVTTYANNDGWLDDIADGPVTATVTIGDRTLEATSAWVVTAPPNYAPGLSGGWRTLHDILEDTWVRAGMLPPDPEVSFRRHIRPLFTRLAALQWVNAGVLRDHGWRSGRDLSSPGFLARLADPSPANRRYRRRWANRFRDLRSGRREPNALPPILGDAAGIWASPRAWIGPTSLQLRRLQEWAAGRFVADGIEEPEVPADLEDVPLARQPASLDRAALEACLGDAFAPGCELPWIMRRAVLWRRPYRIRVRQGREPSLGRTLTPARALSRRGPLNGSVPGALTRWLAIPWQTDSVDCRSGYRPRIDPFLDTFWPARVPNHVLTRRDYAIVMDRRRPLDERRAAFHRRRDWLRGMVTASRGATLNRMVRRWHGMGFVVAKPGPGDRPFPATLLVEVRRRVPKAASMEAAPASTARFEEAG
jgi:hypothetical protein